MLQHECIKKFSKLILNFNFSEILFFLYFDAHKIDSINRISTILKKEIFRVLHSTPSTPIDSSSCCFVDFIVACTQMILVTTSGGSLARSCLHTEDVDPTHARLHGSHE